MALLKGDFCLVGHIGDFKNGEFHADFKHMYTNALDINANQKVRIKNKKDCGFEK
jgi:hypothetical protein